MSYSLKNTHRQHEEEPKQMLSFRRASIHSKNNQIEYRKRYIRGSTEPFGKATVDCDDRFFFNILNRKPARRIRFPIFSLFSSDHSTVWIHIPDCTWFVWKKIISHLPQSEKWGEIQNNYAAHNEYSEDKIDVAVKTMHVNRVKNRNEV